MSRSLNVSTNAGEINRAQGLWKPSLKCVRGEQTVCLSVETVETASSEIKQNYASTDVVKICFDLWLNW